MTQQVVFGSSVTPHRVSLCILTHAFLARGELAVNPHNQQRLALFLISEIKNADSYTERTLAELCERFKQELGLHYGSLVASILVEKLQSLQSPDELFGFFNEELDDLWATGRVERASLLGLFLRKMICSFNDRTFHFISRLFEQLSSYTSNEEGGYRGFISSAQYESFISNEASNIEDSIGTVSREQIQKNIDELNHLVPNMFGAPYLSYLNALSYGDVEAAVDNLHKYYDLIFLLKGGSSSSNAKRPNQPNQPPKLPDLLPYAVLNLASLHFKFRHYHEGLQAILETVKIAQQKSDDECLAHALSWLYRIVAASMDVDQSNKEMMLKRAVERAQELNLPSLAASNSLALAEHYLHHTHGIALPGASPIEASRTETVPGKVWSSIDRAVKIGMEQSVPELVSKARLVAAGCWDIFGHKTLSSFMSQFFLKLKSGEQLSPDDGCLSLCMIAAQHANEGRYGDALETLALAKQRFPLLSHVEGNSWNQFVGRFLHDWALARGHMKAAEVLGFQLRSLLTPKSGSVLGAQLDVNYCTAMFLMHNDQLVQAYSLTYELHRVTIKKKGSELFLQGIPYLLTLAEVHLRASSPISALPFVLSCLSLSKDYHLTILEVAATVLLAEIQLNLGKYKKARGLVLKVYPLIVQHSSVITQGNAHLLLAKSLLGASAKRLREQPEVARQVVSHLEQAYTNLEKVDAAEKLVEIHYLQSRVYHHLGAVRERNLAARRYLRTLKQKSQLRSSLHSSSVYHWFTSSLQQPTQPLSSMKK